MEIFAVTCRKIVIQTICLGGAIPNERKEILLFYELQQITVDIVVYHGQKELLAWCLEPCNGL